MSIDNIRLSEKAKTQLITLKRRTGIQHWNVLCRWAFCRSLAEPSIPPYEMIPADSNVEMTWKTFAGSRRSVYWALLKERARHDGYDLTDAQLLTVFRLHVHRGISYLLSKQSLADVLESALESNYKR
ncbi:DNA sulfur modification protein DndE [Natronocella acetinitrilica]|uniref:DNA sulfur modification protein DndE n=1 Tax=Natronocella acetinitrilica TaxID=414046 RepID=UPI00344CCF9D